MQFIESTQELALWKDKCKLIVPVLSDHKKHWAVNRISFLYFYDLNLFTEAIVSINHSDSQNVPQSLLSGLLGSDNYIHHKKYLSDSAQDYDAQIAFWIETNQPLKVDYGSSIRTYHNSLSKIENLNDSIPIMKWLEWCREVKDKFVLSVKRFTPDQTLKDYDQLLMNLAIIEKNGLFVK